MNKLISTLYIVAAMSVPPACLAAEQSAKPADVASGKSQEQGDKQKPEAASAAKLPPAVPTKLPNSTPQGGFRPDMETMVNEVAPISPDVVRGMRQAIDNGREAEAATPRRVPKPVNRRITLKLTPDATAPVVRLTEGFNTTLVFTDSQGNPWPIETYLPGDGRHYTITNPKKDNVQTPSVTLTPKSSYGIGNVTLYLSGRHPIPVNLTVVLGYQKEVDQKLDVQVEGKSPLAPPPVIAGLVEPSADIQAFADRLPPQDAKALTISGGFGEAWMRNDKIYFRSRFPLQSPAWMASAQSSDGSTTYELPVVPVLMVSHNGAPVMVDVGGF